MLYGNGSSSGVGVGEGDSGAAVVPKGVDVEVRLGTKVGVCEDAARVGDMTGVVSVGAGGDAVGDNWIASVGEGAVSRAGVAVAVSSGSGVAVATIDD